MVAENNDRLFSGEYIEVPDFNLEFPMHLTKDLYLKVLKKIFATIRHLIYKEIRDIVKERKEKYITKNEMKSILHNMDMQMIRTKVFHLY